MPAVPARPTTIAPRPNDVTIAREGSDAFTVGTSAGPALTVCRTFDEAFQRAERFARDHAVSMWYTRDGQTWSSLPDATLLTRIRNEFAEMPGLRLTRDQARRLFALEPEACLSVLESLVDLRFLVRGADGNYACPTEATDSVMPPRMARAGLRPQSFREAG